MINTKNTLKYQYVGYDFWNIEVGFVKPIFKIVDDSGNLGNKYFQGIVDKDDRYVEFQPIRINNNSFKEQNFENKKKFRFGNTKIHIIQKVVVQVGDLSLYGIQIRHEVGEHNLFGKYRISNTSEFFHTYLGTKKQICEVMRLVLAITNEIDSENMYNSIKQLRLWYLFLGDYNKYTDNLLMEWISDKLLSTDYLYEIHEIQDKLNEVILQKNPSFSIEFIQSYLHDKAVKHDTLEKLFNIANIIKDYEWWFEQDKVTKEINSHAETMYQADKLPILFFEKTFENQRYHNTYENRISQVVKDIFDTNFENSWKTVIDRNILIKQKRENAISATNILQQYVDKKIQVNEVYAFYFIIELQGTDSLESKIPSIESRRLNKLGFSYSHTDHCYRHQWFW